MRESATTAAAKAEQEESAKYRQLKTSADLGGNESRNCSRMVQHFWCIQKWTSIFLATHQGQGQRIVAAIELLNHGVHVDRFLSRS